MIKKRIENKNHDKKRIENNNVDKKTTGTTRKHQIETEENPDALFHSLMKASDDGSVPTHLLNRLKQLEITESLKTTKTQHKRYANPIENKGNSLKESLEDTSLYLAFENLLLEEED